MFKFSKELVQNKFSEHFLILITSVLLLIIFVGFKDEQIKTSHSLSGVCKGCNIIIIDIDTLRFDAIDCKNKRDRTPNLCAFSDESVNFHNHISHSDITRASFVSFTTSLYPYSHNLWNEMYLDLDERIILLQELLGRNNYNSSFLGTYNWNPHIIFDGYQEIVHRDSIFSKEFKPSDILLKNLNKSQPVFFYVYIDDLHYPYLLRNNSELKNEYPVPEGLPTTIGKFMNEFGEYLIINYKEIFKDETINNYGEFFSGDLNLKRDEIAKLFFQLSNDRSKQYLLYDAWKPGYEVYLKHIDLKNENHISYLKSNYLEILSEIDNSLSEFFYLLNSPEIINNTIVIIRSDHGEEFADHGFLGHNAPHIYQELIHTPLMIKIPNLSTKRTNLLTQDIDVMPTLLDLIDIKIPEQAQGKSLLPILENPEELTNEYQISQKGEQDYMNTFRKGEWKLIMKELQPIELYNLEEDPQETKNLINENKEKAIRLFNEYNHIISNLFVYGDLEPDFMDGIDEKKRERLKEEGYF